MATIALALMTVASVSACSLLVDTGGLTAGEPAAKGPTTSDAATPTEAGSGGNGGGALDGSVEAAPAVGCPAPAHSCIPGAPDGWSGPLVVYDGPENDVPTCPSSMALARIDAHAGFSAPPTHACSACSCANGSGATCTAQLESYKDSDCTGTSSTDELVTTCKALTGAGFKVGVTIKGGSCSPIGGIPTRPTPSWTSAVRACSAPSLLRTGCSDGMVCTPDAPTPFKTRHCISQAGDVACPGSVYTEKTLAVSALDDTRACTKCTCGSPANSCTGSVQIYANSTCSGSPQSVTIPRPTCTTPPPAAGSASVRLVTAFAGALTCPPSGGGAPTGGVAPSGFATICCAK